MFAQCAYRVLHIVFATLFLFLPRSSEPLHRNVARWICATPCSQITPHIPSLWNFRSCFKLADVRVNCMGQATLVHMFTGQLGAVTYRTDHGDFYVLFLPKSEAFAVQPIERRQITAGTCTRSVGVHTHLMDLGIARIQCTSFSSQINCLSQMIVGWQKTYREHYIRSRNEIPITTPD